MLSVFSFIRSGWINENKSLLHQNPNNVLVDSRKNIKIYPTVIDNSDTL